VSSLSFFNTDNFLKNKIGWYESKIDLQSAKGFVGECCADYLVSSIVPGRISSVYPDTKIIVVVRNPLERAIAEYEQVKKTHSIPTRMTCAQYLTNHPKSQTDGFFSKHLNHYYSLYSPIQLYVLSYEDLVREPLVTMQKLYAFLGIDKDFVPKRLIAYAPPPDEPKHPSRRVRLMKFVAKIYKKIHPPKKPLPFLPERVDITKYFSASELNLFKKTFAADAAQLSNLLHRDMVVEWNLDTDAKESN
jgi:hypothetical protein